MSKLSYNIRNLLALEVYETILPLLYKSAKEGLNYVIINEIEIIKDIEKTIDIIAELLFTKNNVYKILVTRKECTIYLTKNAWRYKREHINSSYNNPVEEEEDLVPERSTNNLIRRLAETYVRALSPSRIHPEFNSPPDFNSSPEV